jgi:hypothetical protein
MLDLPHAEQSTGRPDTVAPDGVLLPLPDVQPALDAERLRVLRIMQDHPALSGSLPAEVLSNDQPQERKESPPAVSLPVPPETRPPVKKKKYGRKKPTKTSHPPGAVPSKNVIDEIQRFGTDEGFELEEKGENAEGPTSTDAVPGSSEKIEILRQRLANGEPLWVKDDRRYYRAEDD